MRRERFRKNGVFVKVASASKGQIHQKKIVDKFEEKASILQLQILQTKTPSNFTSANILPGH